MHNSEQTDKLFAALTLFQGEVTNPPREADNPFFKSKYTQLDAMIDHVRPVLAKHGLSVMQMPCSSADGVGVITTLCHSSGQYIQSDPYYLKLAKQDAQAGGSAITYARRYAYAAILGIASDTDDDGNNASNTPPKEPVTAKATTRANATHSPTAPPVSTTKKPTSTDDRARRIKEFRDKYGISVEKLKVMRMELIMSGKTTDAPSDQMTDEQFHIFMGLLEAEAKKASAA